MVHGRRLFGVVVVVLLLGAGVARGSSEPGTAEAQAGLPNRIVLSNIVRDGTNPIAQGSFSVTATAVKASGMVEVTAGVRSLSAAAAVVDIEIYDETGRRVDQQWFDNVTFLAGQQKSFTVKWQPPAGAAGPYYVSVGLFEPGSHWGLLLHWSHRAAAFTLP